MKNDNNRIDIAAKEEEIINSYEEDEYEEIKKPKKNIFNKIIYILIFLIVISLLMIIIDVVAVSKYNKGPFFAVPLKTYNDGGSKEYYGIGYKAIKYKQTQGRRDIELGTWDLKYDVEPITTEDIDLSIEMYGNEAETYSKYYKKFVRIVSTLQKIDKKSQKLTLGFKDEDGKYTLDIICNLVPDQTNFDSFELNKRITIIGNVTGFKEKTAKNEKRIYISNCFAEQ